MNKKEFGIPIRENIAISNGEGQETYTQVVTYPTLLDKPEPLVIEGIKYCQWCYDRIGILTPLTHKRFLCEEHYKEYRKEKELLRQRAKRKEKKEAGINEYEFALGTSDFSFKMCRKADGSPDFEREAQVVHNELERIRKCQTIGDIKAKKGLFWIPDEDEDS